MSKVETVSPTDDEFEYDQKPFFTAKRVVMALSALVLAYSAYLGIKRGPSFEPITEGGVTFEPVSFHQLSGFDPIGYGGLEVDSLDEAMPASIKDLNGKQVVIQGFLKPLGLKGNKTTEFLLMRSKTSCCFGRTPKLNEVVYVTMKGEGADYVEHQLTTVYGTLEVGEQILGKNMAKVLYRMQAVGARLEADG